MDETTGAKDLRKEPRAKVALVTRLRSPTRHEFTEEESRDVSLGGMFIACDAPEPAGTLLKLECDVGEGLEPVQGVAVVKWQREQALNGMPAGMGVKFIKLEEPSRRTLAQLLESAKADSDGELSAEIVSRQVAQSSAPPPAADAGAPARAEADVASEAGVEARSSEGPGAGEPGPAESEPEPAAESAKEVDGAPRAAAESHAQAAVAAAPQDTAPAESKFPWMLVLLGVAVIFALVVMMRGEPRGGVQPDPPATAPAPEPAAAPTAPAVPEPTEVQAAEPGVAQPGEAEAAPAQEGAEGEGEGEGEGADLPEGVEAAPGAEAEPETIPADEASGVSEGEEPANAGAAEKGAEGEASAHAQGEAAASPQGDGAPKEWIIDVVSTPRGAAVEANGRQIIAPGRFSFSSLDEPVRLYATKPGFRATAATVELGDFERTGDEAHRRVYLMLHPEDE